MGLTMQNQQSPSEVSAVELVKQDYSEDSVPTVTHARSSLPGSDCQPGRAQTPAPLRPQHTF